MAVGDGIAPVRYNSDDLEGISRMYNACDDSMSISKVKAALDLNSKGF